MQDPKLNRILKEMWRLDEKTTTGRALSNAEDTFFKTHLRVIKQYYKKQHQYWEGK